MININMSYASFDLFVFNKSESFDALMVAFALSNVHDCILNKPVGLIREIFVVFCRGFQV